MERGKHRVAVFVTIFEPELFFNNEIESVVVLPDLRQKSNIWQTSETKDNIINFIDSNCLTLDKLDINYRIIEFLRKLRCYIFAIIFTNYLHQLFDLTYFSLCFHWLHTYGESIADL